MRDLYGRFLKGHNGWEDIANDSVKLSNFRKTMSESQKDEKNSRWVGGTSVYYHKKAWKLFGKTYCEVCGIHLLMYLNIYRRRFDMHFRFYPVDYSLLIPEAWATVCRPCHRASKSLELRIRNYSNKKK